MNGNALKICDMVDILNTTGKRLRALRTDRGMTQLELSQRLVLAGASQSNSSLSQYETGRIVPPPEALIALADALETTIDYLMCRTDDPSPVGAAHEVPVAYFSDEADAAARLMDGMTPDDRTQALAIMQMFVGSSPGGRKLAKEVVALLFGVDVEQRRQHDVKWAGVLSVIERSVGVEVRRQVEASGTLDALLPFLRSSSGGDPLR